MIEVAERFGPVDATARFQDSASGRPGLPLRVAVEHRPDVTVIHISGEVDLFGLPTVRAAVGAPAAAVTVDLAGVTFIDAAGVEYLLELRDQTLTHGAAFRLDGPSARVRRVIDLLGVRGQLELAGS